MRARFFLFFLFFIIIIPNKVSKSTELIESKEIFAFIKILSQDTYKIRCVILNFKFAHERNLREGERFTSYRYCAVVIFFVHSLISRSAFLSL